MSYSSPVALIPRSSCDDYSGGGCRVSCCRAAPLLSDETLLETVKHDGKTAGSCVPFRSGLVAAWPAAKIVAGRSSAGRMADAGLIGRGRSADQYVGHHRWSVVIGVLSIYVAGHGSATVPGGEGGVGGDVVALEWPWSRYYSQQAG